MSCKKEHTLLSRVTESFRGYEVIPEARRGPSAGRGPVRPIPRQRKLPPRGQEELPPQGERDPQQRWPRQQQRGGQRRTRQLPRIRTGGIGAASVRTLPARGRVGTASDRRAAARASGGGPEPSTIQDRLRDYKTRRGGLGQEAARKYLGYGPSHDPLNRARRAKALAPWKELGRQFNQRVPGKFGRVRGITSGATDVLAKFTKGREEEIRRRTMDRLVGDTPEFIPDPTDPTGKKMIQNPKWLDARSAVGDYLRSRKISRSLYRRGGRRRLLSALTPSTAPQQLNTDPTF